MKNLDEITALIESTETIKKTIIPEIIENNYSEIIEDNSPAITVNDSIEIFTFSELNQPIIIL